MKILQRKILVLVISSILISALVVMFTAFLNYDRILTENSEQIIQLMCSEKRQSIDEKLLNIEQGVHTIYCFAKDQITENENIWNDEILFSEHLGRVEDLMETVVQYTDGAVSVYYRISPAIKGGEQGIWMVQEESGAFVKNEVTDISSYDKTDIEHVGWYYIPVENGKETWINPYYNQNMEEEIISYVIPIVMDGEVLGVVGMDVVTSLLYANTKTVTVNETGYAFLMDSEGKFVYHPEMKVDYSTAEFDSKHVYLYEKSLLSNERQSVESYQWNGIDKILTSQKLRNGMIFTVCVEEQEIKEPQQRMLLNTMLVIALIMSVFVAGTVSVINTIVKLMYIDGMTRVGNKNAYMECVDTLYKCIEGKNQCDFSVMVVDINDLKKVNDTYGHDYGDLLIQNAAEILKKVWGKSFVYRTGGDEFVVIYSDVKKSILEEKLLLFEEEIKEYNRQNHRRELYLQIAIGMAVYDPETDKGYMDVFHRADNAMYLNKKEKKQKKEH